eukprot:TRINITY_DN1860_c0_g1_i1.p1 TRINITY_DN1860_c0_g1~~TRINITY_DN1860_c0_g1_i1.p1  ORF type:complete len:1253 (-),score=421.85 TRINITY_DN1860_c0_g1_i1:62-3820(-)
MLTKLETKSNRVKGLSFHPTRPWILASLHNGIIQLWDYRVRTLLDRFDEHDGPVRGVCFHSSQPLFVSGGDDYKIKVWNYKQRRCLFTLMGHLDYIRTVEFHREHPWILSASDDQTIRIWNWQSRTCIAVLTGHNHYVMCASFHPKEDLVVSASLDQTVRVWDISGLRKKIYPGSHPAGPSVSAGEDTLKMAQNELFGNTDAIVKYVLEGHDRGVNWAAFHPTSPLIVSGADDRQVKLWRTNETKAWEVDTFRGHFNNVSCVLFHPRQEIIISNSEDKTIRVWDISKRAGIQTFRREHDRFWILAAHPEMNLFAAGHDNGMIVFKLERERPSYVANGNDSLFYVKDRFLRTCEYGSSRDLPVLSLRRSGTSSGRIKSMSYSPQDKAVIVCTDADGGQYELYQIPTDGKGGESVEPKKGLGNSVVFVGRKRFAVLDKSHQIIIKNLKNEETKRCVPPTAVDSMFAAPAGQLLLRSEDKVTLYDVQQRKPVAELPVSDIKYAYWSNEKDGQVALVSKDTIIIANKRLEQQATVHETIRIKSGAWDENGIFIYSTLNHIKYCLPNGDNGIIRTLDTPLYITAVRGSKVFCLDRECKIRVIAVDTTEFMFKHALVQRKYATVQKMVREYNLIGQAIIAYLQKKGFPEVALLFVKDEKTRFGLALECGNIEVALESAKILDDKDCWHRLGVEALRQGNHQIVELAYQRTKNFERISFLYLITGNTDKLKKMVKISQMRNDVMARFHNSLYLGDVAERVKVLEEVGQLPLSFVTAATHGLVEEAEAIKTKLDNSSVEVPSISSKAQLLQPPIPIMKLHESNWPLLTVSKGYFDGAIFEEDKGKFGVSKDVLPEEGIENTGWDELDLPDESGQIKKKQSRVEDDEEEAPEEEGGSSAWDVDLDLGSIPEAPASKSAKSEKAFVVLPQPGPNFTQIWCNNSNLAADHAAGGSFESAMKLLNMQAGIVNFAPLKPYFVSLYNASHVSLPGLASVPALVQPLIRNVGENPKNGLPANPFSLQAIAENKLKAAYRFFTAGKFSDSLTAFLAIVQSIPLIVVDSKKEANEVKELLTICREYITGLRLEIKRKDEDPVRQTELVAYFTHTNIQQIHLQLALRAAMTASFKIKNFQSAAGFARRLLELEPSGEVTAQARKVIMHAETNNENAHQLNYNDKNPFVICGLSFTPIYKGNPAITCPFCSASFLPAHKGKLCPTCQIAEIGKECSGLQLFAIPSERQHAHAKSTKAKKPARDEDEDDDDF